MVIFGIRGFMDKKGYGFLMDDPTEAICKECLKLEIAPPGGLHRYDPEVKSGSEKRQRESKMRIDNFNFNFSFCNPYTNLRFIKISYKYKKLTISPHSPLKVRSRY
jgi:hypothetical protein